MQNGNFTFANEFNLKAFPFDRQKIKFEMQNFYDLSDGIIEFSNRTQKYLNKFQGSKSKKDISAIIDKIVLNLEKNRLIDDRLYSDSKARVFLRRGYSINKIGMALRTKGIGTENIKLSIEKLKEDKPDPDFNSAMKICKKKRIGPLRPEANREIYYKKDMGILARSGFSYDISKKILSMTQKEFNQLYKLI